MRRKEASILVAQSTPRKPLKPLSALAASGGTPSLRRSASSSPRVSTSALFSSLSAAASLLHTEIARVTWRERLGLAPEAEVWRREAAWAAEAEKASMAAAPRRSAAHASQRREVSSMYSSSQAAPPGRWREATRRVSPACAARRSARAARRDGSERKDPDARERSRSSSPRASVA